MNKWIYCPWNGTLSVIYDNFCCYISRSCPQTGNFEREYCPSRRKHFMWFPLWAKDLKRFAVSHSTRCSSQGGKSYDIKINNQELMKWCRYIIYLGWIVSSLVNSGTWERLQYKHRISWNGDIHYKDMTVVRRPYFYIGVNILVRRHFIFNSLGYWMHHVIYRSLCRWNCHGHINLGFTQKLLKSKRLVWITQFV